MTDKLQELKQQIEDAEIERQKTYAEFIRIQRVIIGLGVEVAREEVQNVVNKMHAMLNEPVYDDELRRICDEYIAVHDKFSLAKEVGARANK